MSETNSQTGSPQRVLVVGLGTMGMSHARAYQAIDGFNLVGLCTHNASGRSLEPRQAGHCVYARYRLINTRTCTLYFFFSTS